MSFPTTRSTVILTAGLSSAAFLVAIPPPAASADVTPARPDPATTAELTSGWAIQSSAKVGHSGAEISRPDYRMTGWLPLSKPETLMAGLVENGRYPNVFYGDNLAKVDTSQFNVNWWYRDRLILHPKAGRHTFLVMNGVAGKANLWVNGVKVADQSQLQGSYSRGEYDITGLARDGVNAIALDVSRNDADITDFKQTPRYLTVNMVDWNPVSPDQYTGLQFAPRIAQDGAVSVRDAHVLQKDASDLSTADLTVKATLRNNTASSQRTRFAGTITQGWTRIPFAVETTLPAHATRTVAVSPAAQPRLHLVHPQVWWPYQMGAQPLYHLSVAASVGGRVSDQAGEDFGIRTVTSRLTPVVKGKTHGPNGYRQFIINGVPLVIRGAGWSQDMFLRYSAGNIAQQLSYIKNLGLNAIRFEGNLPPEDQFNQLDRAGILAMPGWQCCNLWEQPSSTWSAEVKANASNQALHVAQTLRDHPSVFTFLQGSDDPPDAVKEPIYLNAFQAADWNLPQVASSEYKSSPRLGAAGTREGSFNYVPPNYWWNNGPETANNEDPTFQFEGSAWGFTAEVSGGNTIPTQDSLNRFLSPADQKKIWDPITTKGPGSGADLFHTFPYSDYTKLGRMGVYNTALWNRYGSWNSMSSYQKLVQMGEYEISRAQFEAYIGNSKDPANPSTGVIYWMLNKAWPSLQWSLYGTDFDQPGVYFGAKKANEPLHIMYDYADGSVKVANLTGNPQTGLRATAQFIDLNGTTRATSVAGLPTLKTQDVTTALAPKAPAGISKTYFLKLTLTRGTTVVSRNVYWLSTKPDQVDWAKTNSGLPYPSGPKVAHATFMPNGYADLSGLQSLGKAPVKVSSSTVHHGSTATTTITIRNTGTHGVPALFTRADLFNGSQQILPIQWSDNDVTLWPGEQQTITATYTDHGTRPTVRISGYNVTT